MFLPSDDSVKYAQFNLTIDGTFTAHLEASCVERGKPVAIVVLKPDPIFKLLTDYLDYFKSKIGGLQTTADKQEKEIASIKQHLTDPPASSAPVPPASTVPPPTPPAITEPDLESEPDSESEGRYNCTYTNRWMDLSRGHVCKTEGLYTHPASDLAHRSPVEQRVVASRMIILDLQDQELRANLGLN